MAQTKMIARIVSEICSRPSKIKRLMAQRKDIIVKKNGVIIRKMVV